MARIDAQFRMRAEAVAVVDGLMARVHATVAARGLADNTYNLHAADVDSRRRLIEQEDIGVANQPPCDEGSLKLAGGEIADPLARQISAEPHGAEHLAHARSTVTLQREEVSDAERDVPNVREPLWDVPDRQAPAPDDRAVVGQKAEQCPEQHGLARAVGPKDGQDFPPCG